MPRVTSPNQHPMARALLSATLRCVIEDGSRLVTSSHKPLPSTCCHALDWACRIHHEQGGRLAGRSRRLTFCTPTLSQP